MRIVIAGSGNVATVLGRKIMNAGHTIVQVVAHHQKQQASALANILQANVIYHTSELDIRADLYIIAVSDEAIPGTAMTFPKVNGVVVHTAGSVSIKVLANTSSNYGVLYPVQSLRKEKSDYGCIPLLIDGNTVETCQILTNFARTISPVIQQSDDIQRLRLHTAAVIVSNFTNHLYTLASGYCQKENVDFGLLQPLIAETADRLQHYDPAQMQTGPAARNDLSTIAKHMELLQAYPQLKKLYEVFTESIRQYKPDNKPLV